MGERERVENFNPILVSRNWNILEREGGGGRERNLHKYVSFVWEPVHYSEEWWREGAIETGG